MDNYTHPGGPGPWFVALLFNTNGKDKKQSEIVSHTYPHFMVDFLNKNTGEIEEHRMSYTVLDEFKDNNPHLERYFVAENLPRFGDGIRMSVPGVGQPHAAFERGVIQRMKETIPGNTMSGHKTKTPREW